MLNDRYSGVFFVTVMSLVLSGCQEQPRPALATSAAQAATAPNLQGVHVEQIIPSRTDFDLNNPLVGTAAERPPAMDLTNIVEVTMTINGQNAIEETPVVAAGEELEIEASVKVEEELGHPPLLPEAWGAIKGPFVSVYTQFASRLENEDDWRLLQIKKTDTLLRLRIQPSEPLRAVGKQIIPLKLKAGEYRTRLYMAFRVDDREIKWVPRWVAEGRLKVVDKAPATTDALQDPASEESEPKPASVL